MDTTNGDSEPFDVLSDPSVEDDVFRALAERKRRVVLYFLLEHDDAPVEEIVDVVTGWCHTTDRRMATVEDRNRVQIALSHVHLPLLEDVGIVTVDSEQTHVSLDSLPDTVSRLLRWSYRRERRTTRTQPN